MRFFAHESCGKCTPCREGTNWLERILQRILDGYGRPSDLALLMDVSDNISPGIAWPPEADHHLPARPVGRRRPSRRRSSASAPSSRRYIAKGMQQRAASAPQTPVAVRQPVATAAGGLA